MMIEVAIIGGGPAGLSAGIFACRAGLKTVLFESLGIGGQAALTHEIANFPSHEKISGFDLTNDMREQAESLGLEIKYARVTHLKKIRKGFELTTASDEKYTASKVIIASGCKARKLNLEKELELTGRGVSYCASCDGAFFKDKVVAVIGGGDTAVVDVEYLHRIAKKVYMINRSENFRANALALNRVKQYKNVEIITSANVTKLYGDEKLSAIAISQNGNERMLDIDGLFVAIGRVPELNFVDIKLNLDDNGYIIVDKDMCTNVKGLFACGDITSKHFRQVITACADGAIAGNSCIGVK